jgi:RNA polymerase sigma-70 factor (ECF subfamily)
MMQWAAGLLGEKARRARFEAAALPHLDSAYNLARWITRNADDAQDVVQDAYLRAFRFFDGFRGEAIKPWLLAIVRHTAFSWLRRNRPAELSAFSDEQNAWERADPSVAPLAPLDPEAALLRSDARVRLDALIEGLPPQFREVVILRELEELSYREIAEVSAIPIGTVMSRLARARRMLQEAWRANAAEEERNGM